MADVKNIWLNYVPAGMIHKVQGPKKEFYNVSFDCAASASGIATVSANLGQVVDATKKDGTAVAGFKNVLLGAPGTKRQVSIKKEDGGYDRVEMTVEEIADAFTTGREEFRASQAAKAPAIEPETEA